MEDALDVKKWIHLNFKLIKVFIIILMWRTFIPQYLLSFFYRYVTVLYARDTEKTQSLFYRSLQSLAGKKDMKIRKRNHIIQALTEAVYRVCGSSEHACLTLSAGTGESTWKQQFHLVQEDQKVVHPKVRGQDGWAFQAVGIKCMNKNMQERELHRTWGMS